jgi:transposase
VVLFLDAAHPTMATKLGYAWSIQGERKVVPSSAGKTRVNIIGSLDTVSMKLHATFHDTVNSDTLGEHLLELRKIYPTSQYSRINIILDQGSYCVSKATAAHAAALQITLIHLPAYSPNLNLIERAWKVMNEQVRNDVYFPDAKTFINAIKNFFTKSWNKISESLRPRFSEPGSGLNTVRLGNFM